MPERNRISESAFKVGAAFKSCPRILSKV